MRAALAAFTFVAIPALLHSQNADQSRLSFEVASVRQNTSETAQFTGGAGGPNIGVKGGRFIAVNLPLREIIRFAYQLEPFQAVEGGPRWLSDRFDINAVIPGAVFSADAPRLMLQTLLAERFELQVRWVIREQSGYALVMARRDKRLGPRLTPSTMDCAAWRAKQTERPSVESLLAGPPTCDMFVQPFRARIVGGARTMADLAGYLSRLPTVGAPVVDRTGLARAFDFELVFAPGRPASPDLPVAPDGPPSLFVALDEQLGLRLERAPAPVQTLVIERAKPLDKE